jgi:hypothetical protein
MLYYICLDYGIEVAVLQSRVLHAYERMGTCHNLEAHVIAA